MTPSAGGRPGTTGGDAVLHAAALPVVSGEPGAGALPVAARPAAAAAATAAAGATATATESAAAEETPAAPAPAAAAVAVAADPVAAAMPMPEPEPEAAPEAAAETAPEAEAEAAAETAPEAAAGADPEAAAEATATATTAAAASTGGSGSGPRGLLASVPGRPGKPMLAAAAVAGVLLIAVPFLISGSDEASGAAATHRADGSPIGPDGSLPGLVPGTQPLAAPGTQPGAPSTDPSGAAAGGALPFGAPPNGAPQGNAPVGQGGEANPQSQQGAGQPGAGGAGTNSGSTNPGSGTPGKADPVAPVAPAKPAPAAVPEFSKLVGPGCGSGGFSVNDQYKNGDKGWRYGTSGWKSNGCDGDFLAMPMSGSATKADSSQYAKWEFSTGPVQSGKCTVYVYIPGSGDNTMVGGNPARYTVRGSNGTLGSFSIDQDSNTGKWVNGGSFDISSAKIELSLDNRGIDWGSGNVNRHIAVAQAKVDCRGK
ncbi:hypothetical protein [Streptomyces sp. NPDC060031]|uniref:hypothetical protein n=1 Tax=Streptomyces sp. NPDC060031 TaxID=3347043 RepID=UPI0036A834B7